MAERVKELNALREEIKTTTKEIQTIKESLSANKLFCSVNFSKEVSTEEVNLEIIDSQAEVILSTDICNSFDIPTCGSC